MTMTNLRFELRAYESTDCVRAAAMIADDVVVHRDVLAARWAKAWPRHVTLTGKRSIRKRLVTALSNMAIAGLIEREDDRVRVLNRPGLDMARRNLAIVVDGDGQAIRPGLWARRPEAPQHLHPVQDALASAGGWAEQEDPS